MLNNSKDDLKLTTCLFFVFPAEKSITRKCYNES